MCEFIGHMETVVQLKSHLTDWRSRGLNFATPGLKGKWFIHYTTVTPQYK